MRQQSFTAEDFEKYRKKTRKDVFLEERDKIVPWKEMGEAVKLCVSTRALSPRSHGHRFFGSPPIYRIPSKEWII